MEVDMWKITGLFEVLELLKELQNLLAQSVLVDNVQDVQSL